jgi:hypothetical protein
MAKSDIAMTGDEMSAEIADLDPRGKGDGGQPEPKSKAEADPGDGIEYVGPEGEGNEAGKPPATAKDADPNKKPDKGKTDTDKPPEGFVPHKALHAEREERKRVEASLAASKREWEAKFNIILGELTKSSQERQALPPPQEDAEFGIPPPDNPMDYIAWRRTQDIEERKQRKQWEKDQAERGKTETSQREQWEAFNRDLANANRDWEQVVAAVPEMDAVLGGLRESFARELKLNGWHGPQLIQKINELESQHAVHAYRQGIPIADYVAQLAAARGVQPPQRQVATNGDGGGERPNGKTGDGAAQIEQLTKAQEAAESLSNTGGGAPGGTKMSFDSFDRMSQKEIEAWVRNATKKGGPEAVNKALSRMMGGR